MKVSYEKGFILKAIRVVMNPSEIMKTLETVLNLRGFQIVLKETDSLLCVRKGKQYRIKIVIDNIEENISDISGDSQQVGIILAPEKVIEAIEERYRENMYLWPLEDLEREMGRIALADQGISSQTTPTFLDRLLSEEQEGGAREPPISVFIQPKVSEDAVREISEDTVKGFEFRMEYVPHYIYIYSIVMKDDEGETRLKEGEIWLNAVYGDFVEPLYEPDLVTSEIVGAEHILEPKIDSDDGLRRAKRVVMEFREEEGDSIREVPGAVAINRKIFLPVEGSLALNFRGTAYMPVWAVEGIRGSIVLDAVRGELINETFFEGETADRGEDTGEQKNIPDVS